MKNQEKFSFYWAGQVCFIAAAILLSVGYAHFYGWAVLLSVTATMLVWYGFRWSGWLWILSTMLVLDVLAAVIGVQFGKNPAWMIAGATVALAGWEIASQRQPVSSSRGQHTVSNLYRFRLLAVVLLLGFVFAEGGLFLHLSIPFWGVFFSGLLILFSLYQFYQTFPDE